jgi:hypothetical protein
LVGVVVHACIVGIVVWIHAVTAIVVGCSAHLNSPMVRLMSGKWLFEKFDILENTGKPLAPLGWLHRIGV